MNIDPILTGIEVEAINFGGGGGPSQTCTNTRYTKKILLPNRDHLILK